MEIPSRVNCHIPIELRSSEISGAGRGVFALADIKAGELIFRITKPLVVATDNSEPAIRMTCDSCFVSKHMTGATTAPVDGLELFACEACGIAYYCGKTCQETAWNHYHKSECKALVAMKDWALGDMILNSPVGIKFRLLIRLLILRDHGKISDSEWTELLELQTHREIIEEENKELMEKQGMEIIVTGIMQYTETAIPKETIKDLFYAIRTNELAIIQLTLRGSGVDYDPRTPFYLETGTCLDPFVSMLNHSCDNNARWVFEGTELRIRAKHNIPSGEEVTIGYVSDGGDYIGRRESLTKNWHFDCTCELCRKGPIAPQGELRDRFVALNESKGSDASTEEVENLIEDIKKAGFGLDAWPMRLLHNTAWVCHFVDGNWEGVMKALITLCFVIELSESSFAETEEKLDTMHHLINNFHAQLVKDLDRRVVEDVWGFLRAKRVADMETFFGADSYVAKYERNVFKGGDKEWVHSSHQRIEAGEDHQESLKKLLTWAGISVNGHSER